MIPWKKQAKDPPDRIWIRMKDREITYGDLGKRILRYADHLQDHVHKGSRIGIWKQDILTTITLFFALLECDCTVVIFSDRDPQDKIVHQSKYIELDLLIQDPIHIDLHMEISSHDHLEEKAKDLQQKKIILFIHKVNV